MATETCRVTVRNCFEGALLQPECIAESLRRFCHIFFARIALRLVRLVTNPTVGWWLFLLLAFPRGAYETWFSKGRCTTYYLEMSLVWKMNSKLADSIPSWPRSVSHVSETRKQESQSIARRYCNVAIRADCGCWSFTRKELLPVTIQTRRMCGELSNIRESSIALANFVRVCSWKFVACIARQLLVCDVRSMRKLFVIYARLLLCPRRGTPA
jgi:hypothetical protein